MSFGNPYEEAAAIRAMEEGRNRKIIADFSFLATFLRFFFASKPWRVLFLFGLQAGANILSNVCFVWFSSVVMNNSDQKLKALGIWFFCEITSNYLNYRMLKEKTTVSDHFLNLFNEYVYDLTGKCKYHQIMEQKNGAKIGLKVSSGANAQSQLMRQGIWRAFDLLKGTIMSLIILWVQPYFFFFIVGAYGLVFYAYSYEFHKKRSSDRKEANKEAQTIRNNNQEIHRSLLSASMNGNFDKKKEQLISNDGKIRNFFLNFDLGIFLHDFISNNMSDIIKYGGIFSYVYFNPEIEYSKLMPFVTALSSMANTIINLIWFYGTCQEMVDNFHELKEFMENLEERPNPPKEKIQRHVSIDIEYTHLGGKRKDFHVYGHLDLVPGQCYLVTGDTGAGKSTVYGNMTGIYPGAHVIVDGKEMPFGVYHLPISYAPQDNTDSHDYSGSIFQIFNVKEEEYHIYEQIIWDLLWDFELDELIASLGEEGLKTPLGGASGGQESRLAGACTVFIAEQAEYEYREKYGQDFVMLLILDEIDSGIPQEKVLSITEKVRRRWRDKNGILLATMHTKEAQRTGWDSIISLDAGKILQYPPRIETINGVTTKFNPLFVE